MVYIRTNAADKVTYIHFAPFDEKDGLGKTKEELEQGGLLVDSIPEPEVIDGKTAELYVDPETEELYYKYVNVPLSEEDISLKLEALEIAQATTDSTVLELMETILLGGM